MLQLFCQKNATKVYYKMRQQVLQNATVLLQNVTVIRKCDVYYKTYWYKPRFKNFHSSQKKWSCFRKLS